MSKKPNKEKSPKRILYAVILSVVVASVGTIVFMEYDKVLRSDPQNENYEVSKWECDGWVQEGVFLVAKNRLTTNMNLWSVEDRTKMIEIENKVLLHCGVSKLDVIQNIPLCIDTWIIISDLLDRMIEREVQSLPEYDQDLYYSNYDKYFDNHCDLLQEDIDNLIVDR